LIGYVSVYNCHTTQNDSRNYDSITQSQSHDFSPSRTARTHIVKIQ
jgi:hypothetical protein